MHFEQQTFIIRYTVDKADLSGELPGYASGQTASPHPLLPWSLALNDSLLYLTSIVNQEQERCLRYKGCSGEKGGENRSQGLPLCICLQCVVCRRRDAPGARQMPVILLLQSRLYKQKSLCAAPPQGHCSFAPFPPIFSFLWCLSLPLVTFCFFFFFAKVVA